MSRCAGRSRFAAIAAIAILWTVALVASAGAARITRYPLPNADSNPTAITAGPDGALWFAERGRIGRITTRGRITEFPLPDPELPVVAITAGPDGAVWFTAPSDNAIGRLQPQPGDARRSCRAERATLRQAAFRDKYGGPGAMRRCIAAQRG